MSLFAFFMPGPQEMIIIAVIGLLIFGPARIPKMARSLGSTMVEFKRGIRGVKEDVADLEDSAAEASREAKAV